MHPETAHAGGPNHSSTIRSMVYFRLKASDLYKYTQAAEAIVEKDAYMFDMWIDFKGLREDELIDDDKRVLTPVQDVA